MDVERAHQVGIPLAGVDVPQQGARGVGYVGHVQAAARELPHQPAVDGAEGELAARGAFAGTVHVVEDPAQLGAREIRIDHQPGALAHLVLQALGAQPLADRLGAAVLPDDGIEDGAAGGAFPHHGGLALVGDAERGHVGGAQPGLFERGAAGGELAAPDVERIVLDPAGLRKMLRKLLLGAGDDLAGAVEHDGTRTGRALLSARRYSIRQWLRCAGGEPVLTDPLRLGLMR